MSVIGFDIGNENSYIATVKSGGIEILDNEYNSRPTPTYIAFKERSRDIGVAAKSKLITNLVNTVFGFKRILGKKYDDPEFEKEHAHLPYEICKLSSGALGIKVSYLKNNNIFSTEQLMAMMLMKLKMTSEVKLGRSIRDCVISVPVYYTDAQRRAMLDAVNIAGLNALKLINESTAVALAYGFFKQGLSEQPLNVIFVDLGNSALTVTACAFTTDKVKILGCVWENVGGRDFDNKLVEYFADDFRVTYQLDVMDNKKALMSLMRECENLKKVISTNPNEVKLHIECFMQDKDVAGIMRRDVFERISEDIFNRIEVTLCRIFSEANLSVEDIHSVEVVGGSSRVPAVKQLIGKIFGREPNATLNQDEAVARGCALQCALISPLLKKRDFVVEDRPSYVIKIVWKNVENHDEELVAFSLSDKMPASKIITIRMRKPFSLGAHFVDSYENLQKIGTFAFHGIPSEAEGDQVAKIRIEACLNKNGIFSLASAKMVLMGNVKEDNTKREEEKKTSVTAVEESPSTPQIAEAKSGTEIIWHQLDIRSDIPQLSKATVNEYIALEQRMLCIDSEEKANADARNALEECVYESRGKLSYDLYDFVLEDDRRDLYFYLNETENWLYENEELDASDYEKRMKDVKSRMDPIYKRNVEWRKRPGVINEYTHILQEAFDALESIGKTADVVNDVENLHKMCLNSKNYLDRCIESSSNSRKFDDVPITVEDMKRSLTKFRNEFQQVYSDVQKKVDRESEAVEAGDGHDPEHYEKNEGSNIDPDTDAIKQKFFPPD